MAWMKRPTTTLNSKFYYCMNLGQEKLTILNHLPLHQISYKCIPKKALILQVYKPSKKQNKKTFPLMCHFRALKKLAE